MSTIHGSRCDHPQSPQRATVHQQADICPQLAELTLLPASPPLWPTATPHCTPVSPHFSNGALRGTPNSLADYDHHQRLLEQLFALLSEVPAGSGGMPRICRRGGFSLPVPDTPILSRPESVMQDLPWPSDDRIQPLQQPQTPPVPEQGERFRLCDPPASRGQSDCKGVKAIEVKDARFTASAAEPSPKTTAKDDFFGH